MEIRNKQRKLYGYPFAVAIFLCSFMNIVDIMNIYRGGAT